MCCNFMAIFFQNLLVFSDCFYPTCHALDAFGGLVVWLFLGLFNDEEMFAIMVLEGEVGLQEFEGFVGDGGCGI